MPPGVDNVSDSQITVDYAEAGFLMLVMGTAIATVHLAAKYNFHLIPESGLVMMVGALFGLIGWLTGVAEVKTASNFNLRAFEIVFLPMIIFESGFSLKKRGLFRNFKTVLAFAFLGTLIACLLTAYSLYWLSKKGLSSLDTSSPVESLLFGALISATDPVATLALMSEVFQLDDRDYDEAPLIYDLVFGESVLNDAVAIVLFNSFEGFSSSDLTVDTCVGMFLNFLKIACLSPAIGLVFGFGSALLFKHTTLRTNSYLDFLLSY